MLNFDKAHGQALEFEAKDGETLIVVTADHEIDGNMNSGIVKGAFATGDHTAVMVPVFSYGPCSENFTGIMENTDIPKKIMKLLAF